jgi:hypothetical protein
MEHSIPLKHATIAGHQTGYRIRVARGPSVFMSYTYTQSRKLMSQLVTIPWGTLHTGFDKTHARMKFHVI